FHRRAAAVFEELSAADGTNATFRRNFAAKTYNVGWAYASLENFDEALKNAEIARAIFHELGQADPANVSLKFDETLTLILKAHAMEKKNFSGAARQYYDEAVNIIEQLAAHDPSSRIINVKRSEMYAKAAQFFARRGELSRASLYLDRAME